MFIEAVEKLEAALRSRLPVDYRAFLTSHGQDFCDPWQLVRLTEPMPQSDAEEALDTLYSASKIVKDGVQTDPERQMLIIGGLQPGGYLYMCFDAKDFGSVYVRYPYESKTFYLVGRSFSEFQSRCRPYPESDA
jgi:SMI1-KNR4 cell-wall